jgi:hypothetical protein
MDMPEGVVLDVFSKGFAPKNGKICMTINTFSQGGFD